MTVDYSIVEQYVDAQGIYGKLFRPSDHSVRPGIIVLGGSGGGLGWSEGMAQELASEGYAALALAYFRYRELPKALVNIPLEYFTKAFDWMAEQQGIDTRRLTLVGGSRGAELALILGSTFPVVKAVIAYAPSSVIWGACGGITSIGKAAWTYRNKPLMPIRMAISRVVCDHLKMAFCLISRVPYRETPLFIAALENETAVKEAIIPVENIKGPILLISGDDDQLTPASRMSEMIMDRLRKYEYPFVYKHRRYEGAGHAINLPDLPLAAYTTKVIHSLTHIKYDLGGDPDINAKAGKQAWNEVVTFLQEHHR
jgi:dienelactone hydrolase